MGVTPAAECRYEPEKTLAVRNSLVAGKRQTKMEASHS